MEISEVIRPESVFVGVNLQSKAKLMDWIAAHAAPVTGCEEKAIREAIRSRESLGSTGIGGGIAIPHAPISGLDAPFGLVACLQKPIDFEAIDDQQVDIVCTILVPPEEQALHLNLLAKVARQLRSEEIAKRLRKAAEPAQVYAAITE